jgi:hypothetical protein
MDDSSMGIYLGWKPSIYCSRPLLYKNGERNPIVEYSINLSFISIVCQSLAKHGKQHFLLFYLLRYSYLFIWIWINRQWSTIHCLLLIAIVPRVSAEHCPLGLLSRTIGIFSIVLCPLFRTIDTFPIVLSPPLFSKHI